MNDQKQQILDKLQTANNILVTVPMNPSVDQLSAAIGVTLLLNKMNKHATAVFSGVVPSTIKFLKPEETLEKDTDSLRDFIIALDKSKADKLRYKVEDEVVKIFITPYKARIDQSDLIFSQGDFNVDVVLALGVLRQQDLDTAITAHGRILHDAIVISVNNQPNGQLGSINWQDLSASGVSELATSLAMDLGRELLDPQISTALLTGIVAETNHFGNQKTTPVTMTMSAALLGAGANQQLVSKELAERRPAVVAPPEQPRPQQQKQQPKRQAPQQSNDGSLAVPHEPGENRKRKKQLMQAPAEQPKAVDEERPSGEPHTDPVVTADEASIESLLSVPDSSKPDADLPEPNIITLPEPVENDFDKLHADAPQHPIENSGVSTAEEPRNTDQQSGKNIQGHRADNPVPAAAGPTPVTANNIRVEDLTGAPPPQPTPTPELDKHETLSDLEQSIGGPHTQEAPTAEQSPADQPAIEAPQADTSPSNDVDSARRAVEEALQGSEEPSTLRQDFNASPVNLTLGHEAADVTAPEIINPGGMPDPNPSGPLPPADAYGAPTAAPVAAPFGPPPAQPASAAADFMQAPPAAPVATSYGSSTDHVIQPISKPFQMPINPATNEQAPLAMSPADQPFTMPLPGAAGQASGPAGSAAPAPGAFGPPSFGPSGFNMVQPGFSVPPPQMTSPTAAGYPPQGPPPPPVPPPVTPPGFGPGM